ncbi:DNA topoisomerase-3 [Paenibacillus sp. UNCCL117]|uniref:DNA topoisomerase 3 n=1 Tax=unclassified Paenibacillus TaxID=185978 RepID=UPI000891C681|nr:MULTISPECIES: DNA topoisomerase 3 [unclassified Paenibacillus]SDC51527.1 DNA topoisomerase-3 [Paenibacillus sp. cl123]SFW11444.1 DNA topoisomerase-3 [Paenibacillus sp. UNCCL117]
MKTLIIAEKPDMGRNIAAAIEPKAKNQRTYIEGERYVITWAIGHLIGLAEPDLYEERYKKWNFNDLPIIPDKFKLVPNPRTKDQLKVIKELAQRCDAIVNACDAGREGQHIFSLIQRHLKLKQPVKRLWISDLTPETIRKGFAELRDGAEFDPLTRAAKARSEADWLIGMNGSRAFTTKHRELLSVGRVQTPVLAILYDRQKEIEAFQSATYYEVEAWFAQEPTEYRGLWQGERLTDKEKAEAIAAKVKGKPGRIDSYEVKDTREYPFKLYDLTLLQREANAKFGFSAKKTLDLAQALYEKHKAISYPRTNSNYVTEQNVPEMHRTLEQLKRTDYAQLAEQADKKLVHTGNRAVCNPTKVEDHHAILPTHKMPGALAPDERKLYDLIVKRFLSHFYPPALYKVHTVVTACEGEKFKSTVKQELSPGWKTVYAGEPKETKPASRTAKKGGDKEAEEESAEEEITTPFTLDAAAGVTCRKSEAKEKETKPPKPYTEGTLLKAMESAGKQIEDEELRDAMKDSGLGTPATRASVIERLKQVGYVVMQGKRIEITTKGRTAVELIRGAGVELLTSPEMTGQWERRLNEIARGSASDETFMQNVKRFTVSIVDKVRMQRPAEKQAFGTESETKPEKPGRRTKAKPGGAADPAAGGGDSPAKRGKRSPAARTAGTTGGRAAGGGKRTAAAADEAGRAEAAAPKRRSSAAGAASSAAATAGAAAGGQAPRSRGGAGASAVAAATSAGSPPPGGASLRAADAERSSSVAPPGGYAALGACPRPGCEGRIIRGKRGYGCSAYKSGCTFVIWKDSFGASLTDTAVAYLLRHGRTARMRLQNEQGHVLEGSLVLKDNVTGKLAIEPADGT